MYIDGDQNLCYKIFGCACYALNYMNSLASKSARGEPGIT